MSDIEEVSEVAVEGSPVPETEEFTAIDSQAQDNYRRWKQNSVKLYDYINTFNTIWPSLVVEFFADKEATDLNDKLTYRLLTTCFTSGQLSSDYLKVGKFVTHSSTQEEIQLSNYNPALEEFHASNQVSNKYILDQNIIHHNDINNAKYSPHKPDLISTINNLGEVHIFDKTRHTSNTNVDFVNDANNSNEFKFEAKLKGHDTEGFGLSWNNVKEGLLLSSSMAGDTKLWDITKLEQDIQLEALNAFQSDVKGTNNVQWNPLHDSIFATVGEDNSVKLYDTRTNELVAQSDPSHHTDGVNCLSFNYHNSFSLATGDSNGSLNSWDLRTLSAAPIFQHQAHVGSISSIQFNPSRPALLASAGQDDNLVHLWDFSKPEDQQLVFKHGGHLLGVNDISWNPSDELMLASVSNDNTLQIWKPSVELI